MMYACSVTVRDRVGCPVETKLHVKVATPLGLLTASLMPGLDGLMAPPDGFQPDTSRTGVLGGRPVSVTEKPAV